MLGTRDNTSLYADMQMRAFNCRGNVMKEYMRDHMMGQSQEAGPKA